MLACPLLVVAAALAAAPDPTADAKPTVLVLNLDVAAGIEKDEAAILDGIIATAVGRHRELDAIAAAELARMMELEGEKQAMGCDDSTSCLGELAGAMGARYVVAGRAGVLGGLVVLSLNLFDSTAARVVARQEARADSLDAAARLLEPRVEALLAAIEGVQPIAAAPEKPAWPLFAGAGAAALGAVGAGVGGTWLALAARDLDDATTSRAQKDTAVAGWPAAVGLTVLGAAVLLGGGALAVVGLGGDA